MPTVCTITTGKSQWNSFLDRVDACLKSFTEIRFIFSPFDANLQKTTIASFKGIYNAHPRYIVRAPGGVNLIGDDTDNNDGFVLPLAINYAVWIALSPVLEMAALQSFTIVSNLSIESQQKVLTGQRAENEWFGVQYGIMNQLASVCRIEDQALLVDCCSLKIKPVLHVVTVTIRTGLTVGALEQNNLNTVGKCLFESHERLHDLFKVSSPALDRIVESALVHCPISSDHINGNF